MQFTENEKGLMLIALRSLKEERPQLQNSINMLIPQVENAETTQEPLPLEYRHKND